MREERANYWGDALESTLAWWELAGVDLCVDDAPRDWLKPAPPPAAPVIAAPAASISTKAPESLESFQQWIVAKDNFPDLGPARCAPAGVTGQDIMLVSDMPDMDDLDQAALFSGRAGRLLDAMLKAIGTDRQNIYLASLSPGRPATGQITGVMEATLGQLAQRHIALARPRAVLLMGDATVRALTGMGLVEARQQKLSLNHSDGTVAAIATFHPRFLIQQPARKAEAWADLQMMMEILNT